MGTKPSIAKHAKLIEVSLAWFITVIMIYYCSWHYWAVLRWVAFLASSRPIPTLRWRNPSSLQKAQRVRLLDNNWYILIYCRLHYHILREIGSTFDLHPTFFLSTEALERGIEKLAQRGHTRLFAQVAPELHNDVMPTGRNRNPPMILSRKKKSLYGPIPLIHV